MFNLLPAGDTWPNAKLQPYLNLAWNIMGCFVYFFISFGNSIAQVLILNFVDDRWLGSQRDAFSLQVGAEKLIVFCSLIWSFPFWLSLLWEELREDRHRKDSGWESVTQFGLQFSRISLNVSLHFTISLIVSVLLILHFHFHFKMFSRVEVIFTTMKVQTFG